MKKNTYDQEDKLFRTAMQHTKNVLLSPEDQNLFKTWIEHLDSFKEENPFTVLHKKSEKTLPLKKETQNSDQLFQNWVQHHGHQAHHYAQYKNQNLAIHNTKNEKNSIPCIDLHGYTLYDAMLKLKQFIRSLPTNTKKARIIHGKGLSVGKPSVIRTEVRSWLNEQKNRSSWLLDFSYESPKNGGHGATIIWIKQGEIYGSY